MQLRPRWPCGRCTRRGSSFTGRCFFGTGSRFLGFRCRNTCLLLRCAYGFCSGVFDCLGCCCGLCCGSCRRVFGCFCTLNSFFLPRNNSLAILLHILKALCKGFPYFHAAFCIADFGNCFVKCLIQFITPLRMHSPSASGSGHRRHWLFVRSGPASR